MAKKDSPVNAAKCDIAESTTPQQGDFDEEVTVLVERLAYPSEDTFEYKKLAHAVANTLYRCQPPFTFAICAPWGGGKSTFLKYLSTSLSTIDPQTIVIHFNAWNASVHTDIVGVFVVELVRTIVAQTPAVVKGRSNRVKHANLRETGRLILEACPAENLVASIGRAVLDGWLCRIDETIQARLKKEHKFRDAFRDLCSNLNKAKITPYVLIDELDRCPPETLVRLIEALRLFFCDSVSPDFDSQDETESRVPFKYVLAIDEAYLVGAFSKQYSLTHEEGSRYISKFIQHTYHFPTKQWQTYVDQVLRRSCRDPDWFIPESGSYFAQMLKLFRVDGIREVRRILAFLIIWQQRYYDARSPVSVCRHLPTDGPARRNTFTVMNSYVLLWAGIKVLHPAEVHQAVEARLLSRFVEGTLPEVTASADNDRTLDAIVRLCERCRAVIEDVRQKFPADESIIRQCMGLLFEA